MSCRPSRGDDPDPRQYPSSPRCWSSEPRLLWTVVASWRSAWRPDSSRAPPQPDSPRDRAHRLPRRALHARAPRVVSPALRLHGGRRHRPRARSRASRRRSPPRRLRRHPLVAAAIGLAVVHIIRPGVGVSLDACQTPAASAPASSARARPPPNVARSSVDGESRSRRRPRNVLGVISATSRSAPPSPPSRAVHPRDRSPPRRFACEFLENATRGPSPRTPLGASRSSPRAARRRAIRRTRSAAPSIRRLGDVLALHGGIARHARPRRVARRHAGRSASSRIGGLGIPRWRRRRHVLRAGAPAMLAAFAAVRSDDNFRRRGDAREPGAASASVAVRRTP